jgi:hypothetical protein
MLENVIKRVSIELGTNRIELGLIVNNKKVFSYRIYKRQDGLLGFSAVSYSSRIDTERHFDENRKLYEQLSKELNI